MVVFFGAAQAKYTIPVLSLMKTSSQSFSPSQLMVHTISASLFPTLQFIDGWLVSSNSMVPPSHFALRIEEGGPHVRVMVILNWAANVASRASIQVSPRTVRTDMARSPIAP